MVQINGTFSTGDSNADSMKLEEYNSLKMRQPNLTDREVARMKQLKKELIQKGILDTNGKERSNPESSLQGINLNVKSLWTLAENVNKGSFKTATENYAEQDVDKDGTVTVKEQKAAIKDKLKNVWTSSIARFFHNDIKYDSSSANTAQKVTQQVKQRIQNALNYIEYAKKNNIDIFIDNTGTGVDDTDGNVQKLRDEDGNTYYVPGTNSTVNNANGTTTITYNEGITATFNDNDLQLSATKGNVTQNIAYNEDGSYSFTSKCNDGRVFHNIQIDQNNNAIKNTGFEETKNGNIKAYAKEGETIDQTLARLGITEPNDIAAVKRANPNATQAGKFNTDTRDVYIPKAIIENMKKNGTYDEDKLSGKLQMGV